MATVTNRLMIAFFDGIGEGVTPTLDFAPQTGFPASRIGGSELFKRCLSPAADLDVTATWDLGSARSINIGMATGNFSADVQDRLQLASDSGISADLIEANGVAALADSFDATLGSLTEVIPYWGRKIIRVFSQDYSRRYTRWRFSDPSNADGYLAIGPVRFGSGFQVSVHSWKKDLEPIGPKGAQKIVRMHEFGLGSLTRDEAYSLEQLFSEVINTRRVLILPEPEKLNAFRHDAIWCTIEDVYSREHDMSSEYSDRRHRVTLKVKEADK